MPSPPRGIRGQESALRVWSGSAPAAFIIANDAAESNLTFLARLASLGHVFEREVLEPAAGGPHTAKLACGPSAGRPGFLNSC